jgi:hypothetical protein
MVCGTTSTAFLTFARACSHISDRAVPPVVGSPGSILRYATELLLESENTSNLVFKDRPSIDIDALRPLPVFLPARGGLTFGSKLPRFEHVPPLPFLPASTVCSALAPCGSVAPRSRSWGSYRFQSRATGSRKRDRLSGTVPGNAIPFEAFPSTAAAPRHRGRCPLVVPRAWVPEASTLPYQRRSLGLAADLKALLHNRVRGCAWRFHRSAARCSLGLVPPGGSRQSRPRGTPRRPRSNLQAVLLERRTAR